MIRLEPETNLQFPGPTTAGQKDVLQTLKITNVTDGHVAFKVKTTAPNSYVVRPSSGKLPPNGEAVVSLQLQMQGLESTNVNSHRFLVQALRTDGSSEPLPRDIWTTTPKDKLEEARLSVQLVDGAAAKATKDVGAANPLAGGSADQEPQDIKIKYDELIQYTLVLEKEKKKIDDELKNQKKKGGGGEIASGYNMFHIILVALLSFLCSYVAKLVGQ